jgi:hypothetical protein
MSIMTKNDIAGHYTAKFRNNSNSEYKFGIVIG